MTARLDEVHTPRLVLLRPQESDLLDMVRMHQDPRVMATLGGRLIVEEDMRARFARLLAHWSEHGFGRWIFRDRATNRFAGRGGLSHLIIDGKPEIELGYGFLPEFWGRGLATEVAAESVRVGFEDLGLPEIICFTQPTNLASKRVMEKVGFRFERDGVWCDLPHIFYRLTREQWRASSPGRPAV